MATSTAQFFETSWNTEHCSICMCHFANLARAGFVKMAGFWLEPEPKSGTAIPTNPWIHTAVKSIVKNHCGTKQPKQSVISWSWQYQTTLKSLPFTCKLVTKLSSSAGAYLKNKASLSNTVLLTFTSLSHPHDTIIGFCVFGEKRTHDVQSVWHSSYKWQWYFMLCTFYRTDIMNSDSLLNYPLMYPASFATIYHTVLITPFAADRIISWIKPEMDTKHVINTQKIKIVQVT